MVRKRRFGFQWAQSFFGLPSNYDITLHEEIFTLCYYIHGFGFEDVYSMPVHFRKFYLRKLRHTKEEERKEAESATQETKQELVHKPPHVKK